MRLLCISKTDKQNPPQPYISSSSLIFRKYITTNLTQW